MSSMPVSHRTQVRGGGGVEGRREEREVEGRGVEGDKSEIKGGGR